MLSKEEILKAAASNEEYDASEYVFKAMDEYARQEALKALNDLYAELRAMKVYGQHERVSHSGVLAKTKLKIKAIETIISYATK